MNKYQEALDGVVKQLRCSYVHDDTEIHLIKLQELVDKSTPFIPTDQYFNSDGWQGKCRCGRIVKTRHSHCIHCGQRIIKG